MGIYIIYVYIHICEPEEKEEGARQGVVCRYIYLYQSINIGIYRYIYIYMYIYICVYTIIHIYTYICVWVLCVDTHTHIYIYFNPGKLTIYLIIAADHLGRYQIFVHV